MPDHPEHPAKPAQAAGSAQSTNLTDILNSLPELLTAFNQKKVMVFSNWKDAPSPEELARLGQERQICAACYLKNAQACSPCHIEQVFETGLQKSMEQESSILKSFPTLSGCGST